MLTAHTIDAFASATDMLQALRNRQISAVELLELHLDRIERYNSRINAIVVPNYAAARKAAAAADTARTRGEDRPLLGLPLTIKDCIYVQGLPTTGGVPERANAIAAEDSILAARVRAAGAIMMGKTNVPPYAGDIQAWNPLFGRTDNPWNLDRTPGGSSGGSAAALAAGLTPLEFGGDFAGSIRQPAAFCGVYGHKASETALARTGHFPGGLLPNAAVGMAVQGPLARSAHDLALAFDVVAGPDVGEDAAWQLAMPPARHKRLADYRVAIMPPIPWLPVDDEIMRAQEELAMKLDQAGAHVAVTQPELFGDLREYHKLYLSVFWALMYTGRSVADRAREAAEFRASEDEWLNAYADGIEASASDYIIWYSRREQYRAAYRAFFRDWDVLITPCNIVNAFPHDDRPMAERTVIVNGHPISYDLQMVHPGLANFSGHPATAFPAGQTHDGLPIGLQATGPYLEDYTPMHFAALVAEAFGGFQAPPGYEA